MLLIKVIFIKLSKYVSQKKLYLCVSGRTYVCNSIHGCSSGSTYVSYTTQDESYAKWRKTIMGIFLHSLVQNLLAPGVLRWQPASWVLDSFFFAFSVSQWRSLPCAHLWNVVDTFYTAKLHVGLTLRHLLDWKLFNNMKKTKLKLVSYLWKICSKLGQYYILL